MPLINNICEDCKRLDIWKWADKVSQFKAESKKPIGVTIEIKDCDEKDLIK